MSANETVPILINTSGSENEAHGALSIVCSDGEDVPLVPEVVFESALDSPGINRESQPLLGGLDVSYNQFPGIKEILYLTNTSFSTIYVYFR